MDFRPDEPMHNRYAVSHDFLSPSAGHQAVAISRIVNAFFGWEFNSCEMLVAGDYVHPIDYANACPDVAVTSLHYYFPWAISALVKWSVFSLATGRRSKVDLHTERYFAIADDESLDYDAKLDGLSRPGRRALRDREVPRMVCRAPGRLRRCASATGSPAPTSTACSARPSRRPTPQHEQEKFLSHFKGLTNLWLSDQTSGSRET